MGLAGVGRWLGLRIANLWKPKSSSSDQNGFTLPPAPGGFQPIKIRSAFRNVDREVRMMAVQGRHVVVQSCDDGPQMMTLIDRGAVHQDSLAAFDRFVSSKLKD